MPKKTREEKKLSEYRKRMQLLHQLANKPTDNTTSHRLPKKSGIAQIATQQYEDTKVKLLTTQTKYFIHDLRKSLFLIAAIITLEIIIYFASMNRYFQK